MISRVINKNSLRFCRFCVAQNLAPKQSLYLDNNSTTPVDFRVLDSMLPFMTSNFGNPHSNSHEYGWQTEEAIEKARLQIAKLINADPREVIFTSGATESNNQALKGLVQFYGKQKNHIITTQIEHKCILDTCRQLEEQGVKVTYLPVQQNGLVDLDLLKSHITEQTLAVSVIHAHNEIGVIQNVKEIGKICRSNKVFFHTDCAQSLGKIPIDVNDSNIDLMSLSSHKIYGPKGIGALFIRRKPKVRLLPLINGGGQERGQRSGTLSPALCVGFGKACEVAGQEMKNDQKHIKKLFDKLYTELNKRIPNLILNGDLNNRLSNNLNMSYTYVEGESLLMAIKDCAVSSGSACTSASLEPSYVLRALGVNEENAHSSIRIGIGRFTTEDEIDFTIEKLASSVKKLREMSPLWEMVQEGVDLKTINWSHH